MTTYYVGVGGNNANAGTSWALRKLTLTGAEDIPVAAGDTVYVGPGTYREALTVDVSGGAGNHITYIGDYTGANTDGVGGVVRITGSDNDQSATRANCIVASGKNYRTFTGFLFSMTTGSLVMLTSPNTWTINNCYFSSNTNTLVATCLYVDGSGQAAVTLSSCFAMVGKASLYLVTFTHSGALSEVGHQINNCIFVHHGYTAGSLYIEKVGGITVKNSTLLGGQYGVLVLNLAAGQTTTVTNNIVASAGTGLYAGGAGMITEDYNAISGCTTARTNVSVGAASNAYPPLLDTRWFFEAVNGGRLISPFDLASYSQLVNVAGTSPTTTDLRGTAAIGGQREWGALEYDSTLILPAAAEVTVAGGGTYHEPSVGEVIDTAVYGPASGTAGTFAIPAEADVKDGVFYGAAGTEFEGELVAGGGGGGVPVIGGNVVRR